MAFLTFYSLLPDINRYFDQSDRLF